MPGVFFSFSPKSIDCHKVVSAFGKSEGEPRGSLCVCKCAPGAYICIWKRFPWLNVSRYCLKSVYRN